MKQYYEADPRACLESIMLIHPRLCLNGYDGQGTEEKRREMLESHVEVFYRCCVLLESVNKSMTFNRHHDSYGLKHVLERALGMYVANGIAIAALVATGYAIVSSGGVNVRFNMSERDYKSLSNMAIENLQHPLRHR
jgi:hypothetical protein